MDSYVLPVSLFLRHAQAPVVSSYPDPRDNDLYIIHGP